MDSFQALQEICPKTTRILFFIGLLIVLRKVIGIIKKLYILILRKRINLKKRYGENSWVFITGSSDGIGKALALQFANEGFNIILSARTVQKLKAVQQQIKNKYPKVEVKMLPADYKKATQWRFIENLLDQISELDISIVVNNVGMDVLDNYTKLDAQKIEDLIKLNCFPVAFINRYFLSRLKKRNTERKIKSCIVNVASIAGIIPMPYYNIYSASKAYVDKLSRSLAYENPEIDIISLRPSEVSTPMTFNKQTDIFTITAKECARGLMDQLGHSEKTTFGFWRHQLQGWLYEAVPESMFNFIFTKFVAPADMKLRQQAAKKQH